MSKDATRTGLRVPLSAGGVPHDSEEGRSFLQERLAFFGRVSFCLCFGFYVVLNLARFLHPSQGAIPWSADPFQMGHLSSSAILAAVWGICRTRRLSPATLSLVDAVGTVAVCLGFSAPMAWADLATYQKYGMLPEYKYGMLLALTNTVIGRAVIVPSTAGRSFWITAAGAGPAAYVSYAYETTFHQAPVAAILVIVASAWCVTAVAMATLASRVIYGLREKVREARRLGQYTLEEKLGEGGMGAVYKASHAMLRRPTAVKLLPPGKEGEVRLKRFEREVQLTSLLTHPNTVSIFDYGRTPDGVFYYAMEFLDGVNLDELVREDGPQPAARVVHVLRQVCGSLGEAHGVGLIHRDVKPANIILCERGGIPDVAKVFDFGLVKELDDGGAGLTRDNAITGTPLYLAPEVITAPETVDARSDLYAVGAVCYYLLAGGHVFEGKSLVEVCSHHLHSTPVPPSQRLGRPLPAALEALVLRCLEKDPQRRPRTARELDDALAASGVEPWGEEQARAWWQARADRIQRSPVPSTSAAAEPSLLTVHIRR